MAERDTLRKDLVSGPAPQAVPTDAYAIDWGLSGGSSFPWSALAAFLACVGKMERLMRSQSAPAVTGGVRNLTGIV